MGVKIGITAGVIVAIALGVWITRENPSSRPGVVAEPELAARGDEAHPALAAHGSAPLRGISPRRAGQEGSTDSSAAPHRASEDAPASALRIAYRDVDGRVIGPDGGGVAGVKVVNAQRASRAGCITDASGAFRIERAATIDGVVEIAFADVPSGFLRPKPVRMLAADLPVVVTLEPALSVTGHVVAPPGVAYGSLRVLSQDAASCPSPFSRRGTLDADGRFVIDGLRPKTSIRVICHDLWKERPAPLRPSVVEDVPAGASGVEVVMHVGHVLDGVAYEADGSPYASKQVMLVSEQDAYLGGQSRRTGADGSFRFTGLASGVYYAGLTGGTGSNLIAARRRIEVPRGLLELHAGLGPHVAIRLRRPSEDDELDLGGFVVSAAPRSGPWHLDGYTFASDERGLFSIPTLPKLAYDLFVRKPGTPWFARVRNVGADGRPVQVALERGLRLEGRVLDVNGRPLRGGGHVDLVIARFAPHTEIRPDGTFAFEAVPPGRHTLRVHPATSSLALWEHGIESGRTDVVLELKPTAR